MLPEPTGPRYKAKKQKCGSPKYGTNHAASRETIYANRLGTEKLVETQFF
jgi:hypothetical protein